MVTCSKCGSSLSDAARFCPDCGTANAAHQAVPDREPGELEVPALPSFAQRKRVNHNNGGGCLVALIGVCIVWIWPLGTLLGILLIVIGSRISYKFVCSQCGNPLESTARLCPACRSQIQ